MSTVPVHASTRRELFSFLPPEVQVICRSAHRRLQSWKPPPHRSEADWSEERAQIAEVAAHQAVAAAESSANGHDLQFIYNHIIATVRTLYRREWTYGLHFEPCEFGCAAAETDKPELKPLYSSNHRCPACVELLDAIEELEADERMLIEQLFLLGKTEAQVGETLSISQSAISQRKQSALNSLAAILRPRSPSNPPP